MLKVSEIEKLIGIAGMRSVAQPLAMVSAMRIGHSGAMERLAEIDPRQRDHRRCQPGLRTRHRPGRPPRVQTSFSPARPRQRWPRARFIHAPGFPSLPTFAISALVPFTIYRHDCDLRQ